MLMVHLILHAGVPQAPLHAYGAPWGPFLVTVRARHANYTQRDETEDTQHWIESSEVHAGAGRALQGDERREMQCGQREAA